MCGVIAHVGQPPTDTLRRLIEQSSIRGLHNFGHLTQPNCGLYHWRYVTSGLTNQPLYRDGTWLAFNGVIDMGTKPEMEAKYNCKLLTDNDGELLLALNEYPENMIEFIRQPAITFAGVVIRGRNFYAFRNAGRPLWKVEGPNGVLIASTYDIFKRSGIYDAEPLEPLKLYKWTF